MHNRKYILPVLILVFGLWGTCEACRSLPGSPGISYEQQVSDSVVSVSILPIKDFIPEYGVYLQGHELYVPVMVLRNLGERAYSSVYSVKLRTNSDSVTSQKKIKVEIDKGYQLITYTTDSSGNNKFLTEQSIQGGSEQILIKGPLGPFPYNSQKYACSMPFYDENSERLYFCSTMPGSLGGWDIYYSEREDGQWGTPHNLGRNVNTSGNDVFPSVTNGLLIYSSNVRPGNSDFDNYLVKIGMSTFPVPMKLINTGQSDYCLRIASVNPFRAIGVRDSSLVLYHSDNSLKNLVNRMNKPDIENNVVVSPADKMPAKNNARKMENVGKKSVKINWVYRLHFKTDSIVTLNSELDLLDTLANKIDVSLPCRVLISGYADASGNSGYNDWLSYKRAEKTKELLKAKAGRSEDVDFVLVVNGKKFAGNTDKESKKDDRSVLVKVTHDTVSCPPVLYACPIDSAGRKISINRLSDIFGLEQAEIERINQLIENPKPDDFLYVGIQCIHQVRSGESLFLIGKKYGCEVDQLRLVNHLGDDKIEIGEFLIIPYGRKNRL